MALIATKKTDFKPIEPGVYVGIVINVIDLGIQKNEKFNKEAQKVLFTFELPKQTIEIDGEEKPRLISKQYTLSLHEKAKLRGDLETIRSKKFTDEEINKGFNVFEMIGNNCQLQVEHNENGYATIVSVMALPKGAEKLELSNEPITFDIQHDDIPEGIPEWVQNLIKKSKEYNTTENEEIPF